MITVGCSKLPDGKIFKQKATSYCSKCLGLKVASIDKDFTDDDYRYQILCCNGAKLTGYLNKEAILVLGECQ